MPIEYFIFYIIYNSYIGWEKMHEINYDVIMGMMDPSQENDNYKIIC